MLKNTMKKIIFIMIIIMFNSFQISDVNATDAKNNNPMLKAIKINGIDIEPTFDMLTTEYVVNVDNSVEKVEIEAIPDDSKAEVNVIGDKNLKEGKITIGPFDIEVIYTKGHTNDSVTYYFKEEKIMFTGDFIFKNSIGRTDLGGNTKDMIESINKIKHYDDSIIIYPGHGEYTTLSSEKENNEFFNTLH